MALSQLVPVASASALEAERQAANATQQQTPLIQGLAAHVRTRWESAKTAKTNPEQRLLQCLRQRNGEYDPDKLAAIKQQGGSEIFMMLTSVKCRSASAWLRDTLLGTGADKPWTLDATPIPDLPDTVIAQLKQVLMSDVQNYMQQNGGQPPPEEEVRAIWEQTRDRLYRQMNDEASKRVERMELKMEDQLVEGCFSDGMSEFIEDIVTFPTATMKGPVARKRKTLEWKGGGLVPVEKIALEWERVDPFMCYPAAWATSPQDGPFIERHKLTREALESMIGVEGFSEPAIREILANFGGQSLESLSIDAEEADATGKDNAETERTQDVVDALQLWDTVQGKLLSEWGMKNITDMEKSYPCEVWLIGSTVIKAVLNYDPLGRKPYYTASYEKIPGAYWGNGVADLIRDCQAMCNAAARSLSNNMGISSGPQVGLNVSRLPPGEKATQMYPWKIWQFQNSDYQDAGKPLDFFQPQSNANELMAVFDKFQTLADEYSGIPRYMQGEHAPGAGRTASGLSMLISNASKAIKSVISSIDHQVITPLLVRLYQHNLRYSQDPDLIGDINIVAKGAMSLVAKESQAVRRNELLQLVLTNDVAQQIMGPLGTAELLRENAKMLDIDTTKLIPSREDMEAKVAKAEAMQAQQMEMQTQQQGQLQQQEQGQQQFDNSLKVRGQQVKERQLQLQEDGTPKGGRQGSLMANRATGNSH